MKRPSHWILLFTVLAGVGYALVEAREDIAGAYSPGPTVVHRNGEAPPAEPALLLQARVLDRLGWPVPGATLQNVGGGPAARTDLRGRANLTVAARQSVCISVLAERYQPAQAWLLPGDEAIVVLADAVPWSTPRPPTATAVSPLIGEGFVRDQHGAPAAGATVTVVETGLCAKADDTGRYRIPLPDGAVSLAASDEAGGVATSEPVFSTRKQGLVPLPDLELSPGLTLRGFVRNGEGEPSAEAGLCVRGLGVRREVSSDASGAFACQGLRAGTYVLEALPNRGALGFARKVTLDRDLDLEVDLVAPRALALRVLEERSGPVAGVHVVAEEGELRRAHGITDGDGRTELTGLGPGPFSFEVRAAKTFATYDIVGFVERKGELTVRAP